MTSHYSRAHHGLADKQFFVMVGGARIPSCLRRSGSVAAASAAYRGEGVGNSAGVPTMVYPTIRRRSLNALLQQPTEDEEGVSGGDNVESIWSGCLLEHLVQLLRPCFVADAGFRWNFTLHSRPMIIINRYSSSLRPCKLPNTLISNLSTNLQRVIRASGLIQIRNDRLTTWSVMCVPG